MTTMGRPKLGRRAINATIKARREALGMTKAAFARELRVDKAMPTHWDNERCAPSPMRLPEIARVLKMSLGRLKRELREVIA